MISKDETIKLAACISGSILSYKLFQHVSAWHSNRQTDWVPVGRIKELYVCPIKSCKPKKVFSFFCEDSGPRNGENLDRTFLIVDETGHFFTARVKPQMVKIQCDVRDGFLHLKYGDLTATVDIQKALEERKLVKATLHRGLTTTAYDCGEQASMFFSKVIDCPNARLVVYAPGLHTERTVGIDVDWLQKEKLMKRKDIPFKDEAPFHIVTQSSVDAFNKKTGRKDSDEISALQFRPSILIEGSEEWDEDKWGYLKIGDVQLQCFKPCSRCIMTTIDPVTGEKDDSQQVLKQLKEFRQPPEGKIRDLLGNSPLFGLIASLNNSGYIYEGQTVYAKYTKSLFEE